MKERIREYFQKTIDDLKPSLVDKIVYYSSSISILINIFLYISTFTILFNIEIDKHSKLIYSLIIIHSVAVFYFSMLGDRVAKPSNRDKVYLYTTISIALSTYSMLAEEFNSFFVDSIHTLIDMTVVPTFIVETNSKIITIFIPFIIVAIVFYKSISVGLKKEYLKEIQGYSVEWLSRNIENIEKYNIDCKICDDYSTGNPIYLTEKQSFRHMLVAGNSGSGKTSLVLRPYLAQLFYKKSIFRERLKSLVHEALDEGLCYINVPVTNKYFNDFFTMDMITINEDKKDIFIEKFNDLIIGVRQSENIVFNEILEANKIRIPILNKKDIIKTTIDIAIYKDGIIEEELELSYKSSEYRKIIKRAGWKIGIRTLNESEKTGEENEGENISDYNRVLEIATKVNEENRYTYKVKVIQHSQGKVIYRNTGVTTIAPDGGLGEQTVKIGEANGVKVHKIDPKLEEINKGNIARYNPMMLGEPEKTGDIIASILIGMEDGDVNPYYKNAGIRAIRNIIILLRVMYPLENNGQNPTLEDVLDLLNDFTKVEKLSRKMSNDDILKKRWKSVIEYFETSFYEMQTDEGTGNRVKGTNFGVKRNKTQEAVAGIINQLDNFIGREEIRYILCSRDEGLNLEQVLENGECIAIATRQAELGDIIGRAFALFFIMSLQTAVLSRYSEDEAPEIPYEILIDEFPFYLNDQSKVFFTFSRKYKCAVTCVIQNMAQLREQSDMFKEIVLTNTNTKVILPGANVEDRMYYSEMLGFEDVFEVTTGITTTPLFAEKAKYQESKNGAMVEKNRVSKDALATLEFKSCYYSITDTKGKLKIGKGTLDFLALDTNNTIKNTYLDFNKHLENIPKHIIDENKINKLKRVIKVPENAEVDYGQLTKELLCEDEVEFVGGFIDEKNSQVDSVNVDSSKDVNKNLDENVKKESLKKSKDRLVNCNEVDANDLEDAELGFADDEVKDNASDSNIGCNKVEEHVVNTDVHEYSNKSESKQTIEGNETVEDTKDKDTDKVKMKLKNLYSKMKDKDVNKDFMSSLEELLNYKGKLVDIELKSDIAKRFKSQITAEKILNIIIKKKSNDDVVLIIRDEDENRVRLLYNQMHEMINTNNNIANTDFQSVKIQCKSDKDI